MKTGRAETVRLARIGARIAVALATPIAGYAAAGFIGGAIPRNADWRAPADGIRIFVESNGVHTGIVVPKVAAGVDWRRIAPARDLADPRYGAYDHLSIGWGEARFYRETPTWADVRAATVLAAAIGSERTLMHVDHVPLPRPGADVRAIVVTPAQYRRLARYIAARFVAGGARYRGYYDYDAFYAARGRYSAVRTCNAWTGDALRHAGIRVGAWTPFPATVMWWF